MDDIAHDWLLRCATEFKMAKIDSRPVSEQFRLIAKEWVEVDGEARLLEEMKSSYVASAAEAMTDVSVAGAERAVKASAAYKDYVQQMVGARTKANLLKVKLEWIRMRFSEQQSVEATARAERRL